MNDGGHAGARVDLVIPVYGRSAIVRRCLESVLRSKSLSLGRVVVIDDASPDRATREYLDTLRERGAVEVVRHAQNRGFVAAANAGFGQSDRDVVLLNSDTEVHGDWIERLVRCAYRAPDIGTVTPFSNNATICSYPFPPWRRRFPAGRRVGEIDRMFAAVNAGGSADLPTGVGFCLLVRRACLEAIGPFDEARFGRGYGEEGDFCQRARLAGWRSVVCADVFVYHEARATFGVEGKRRARDAETVLRAMYPDYAARVRGFILEDPLGPFRRRVDAERQALSAREAAAVQMERIVERTARLAWRLRR